MTLADPLPPDSDLVVQPEDTYESDSPWLLSDLTRVSYQRRSPANGSRDDRRQTLLQLRNRSIRSGQKPVSPSLCNRFGALRRSDLAREGQPRCKRQIRPLGTSRCE